ncbi:uncharacterized protein LOC142484020 [Ascaphus truei]|uniref:uncharacterized protein LOC142484020 n=1 Tax=Ascaphus truei TaxID=8439 RepID=UPI003F5ACECF
MKSCKERKVRRSEFGNAHGGDIVPQTEEHLEIAPEGHVSPETEQVSSPGSASSTHLEEHDEEDYDDDDDDATAIDTQIEASDHEDVPIETVLPANRPANTTYDAIVASEGKIVEAENRRHSDFMTVLERMIALQEETVSQLAHLHRVFIEVPKQLQKINTSFEALVVQQTQANYWRMTNVPQFNTSQPGSVHAASRSFSRRYPACIQFEKLELSSPGAKSGFPQIGVIREFGDVRKHLNLVASHIFKELATACRGVRMVDLFFLASQIRLWISIGVQHAFSSSTHLRRLGSKCHCTI